MDAMVTLMADSDHFADIMKVIVFFALLFVGGVLFEAIGGSPLVAEILIGIIFGPNGLNFVPDPAVSREFLLFFFSSFSYPFSFFSFFTFYSSGHSTLWRAGIDAAAIGGRALS